MAKKKEQEKWRHGVSSLALAKVKELCITLGECSPYLFSLASPIQIAMQGRRRRWSGMELPTLPFSSSIPLALSLSSDIPRLLIAPALFGPKRNRSRQFTSRPPFAGGIRSTRNVRYGIRPTWVGVSLSCDLLLLPEWVNSTPGRATSCSVCAVQGAIPYFCLPFLLFH